MTDSREQYLLDKLSQRDQLSAEEVQAVETEYQEVIAVRQREEQIDEKVHADEIPFSITGVDISGFPVEVIQFVEEVVKEDRKRIYNEHAIELEQLEAKLKECESVGLERGLEIDRLIGDKLQSIQENASLDDQLYNVVKELADAQAKRDAAVAEKEDREEVLTAQIKLRDNELDTLRAKLSEYEQAEEYRQRQEQPLAVSAEESTSLQEKADAVKKLFTHSENWGSSEKLYLPDGSFTVIPRKELEDWESANVPNNVESVEEFREPIPAPEIATLQEHTVHGEVDAEGVKDDGDGETFGSDPNVTRYEFDQLKTRVDYLFLSQGIIETLKEAS